MKKTIAMLVILGVVATSCASNRSCHSKKAYVPKHIKKAQSRPRH